jgi:ATP-dependent helicase/nuclease subunit B
LFARRILRLRSLDPIDADPGVMERGIFIHRALEEFVAAHGSQIPADAVEQLIILGERTFGAALAQPAVWSFWWPRFERIAKWFITEMHTLIDSGGTVPVAVEVRGNVTIQVSQQPFELVAKADRIDQRADGSLVIVDYKTGGTPSQKDIELGLSPQLSLEAWIAQSGGFSGVDPGAVSELAYWRLSGGANPGQIVSVRSDVNALIERARAGLQRLVEVFDDPATPYRAIPRPRHATRYGDYDHLARVAEWSAGSDGDTW